MSYKGGDRAEFGIIESIDNAKEYAGTYEPERYHCVAICDDALNDWWERLVDMKSYFHRMDRPSTALARYGVTLIPPESLELLIEIIKTETKNEFMNDALEIVDLLKRAVAEQKFVIHYGI